VKGELELAEHRPENALALFEAAHVMESRDMSSLEAMASALAAAGRLDDATGRYEELIRNRELGGEEQEEWIRAHVSLGGLYEKLGRTDYARRTYQELVDLWVGGDSDLVALRQARAGLTRLGASTSAPN